EGVPVFEINKSVLNQSVNVVDLLVEHTRIFSAKGELRRLIAGNGLSINKEKFSNPDTIIGSSYLINNKYILIQKGKKNYYIIKVND
ncbi:MAG: tyrosine--tRNA ligase, partial [Bacteroidota bacterium]